MTRAPKFRNGSRGANHACAIEGPLITTRQRILHKANSCTKLEAFSFSRFRAISGGVKNSKMGHVTLTTLLLGMIFIGKLVLAIVNLYTKFEVFIYTRRKIWKAAKTVDKKLSYRRGTARCVESIEILPVATQQCRNYLYDKSWPNRWYEVGDLVGGNAW